MLANILKYKKKIASTFLIIYNKKIKIKIVMKIKFIVCQKFVHQSFVMLHLLRLFAYEHLELFRFDIFLIMF